MMGAWHYTRKRRRDLMCRYLEGVKELGIEKELT
jgi:hypothetical protein